MSDSHRARATRTVAPPRRRGGVITWTLGVLLATVSVVAGCAGGNGAGASTTTSSSPIVTTTTSAPATTSASSTTTIPFATTTTAAPRTTVTTADPGPVTIPDGGKEVVRLAGAGDVVALTFDAAYDPAPLHDILAALEAAGVPATFFLTGEFARDFPAEVAAIVAAGFPVGSHTYSHPDLTTLDDAAIRSQLDRTRDALAAAGAPDPRPLFRFPYGARDSRVLAEVGAAGYISVYWTIDTLDWKPERTPAEVKEAVLSRAAAGSIVLMHVGSRQTAEVLPEVIVGLKARGFGFVDLRTALADAPGGDE